MNIAEITREVKRDYEKIRETTLIRLGQEYDRERKKFKIDKKRTYAKIYTFKTASKNNWMIMFAKAPSSVRYENRNKDLIWSAVTWYYDKIGLMVLQWTPQGGIQAYTGHLFQRYKERLKLDLDSPVEIVKHFFLNNLHASYQEGTRKGKLQCIGYTNGGLLLGEQVSDDWLLWKTFVSRDLFHAGQNEIEQKVISLAEMELINSIKDEKVSADTYSIMLDNLAMLKGRFNPL